MDDTKKRDAVTAVIALSSQLCHGDRAIVFEVLVSAVGRMCASSQECSTLIEIACEALQAGGEATVEDRMKRHLVITEYPS